MYRVMFLNQGKVYEVYVKHVSQPDLYGFVAIEDFVFGEKSSIVIDPTEARVQNEFAGVKRAFIPMHAVVRIDEVEQRGATRITAADDADNKIMPFPIYTGPRAPRSDNS